MRATADRQQRVRSVLRDDRFRVGQGVRLKELVDTLDSVVEWHVVEAELEAVARERKSIGDAIRRALQDQRRATFAQRRSHDYEEALMRALAIVENGGER